MGSKTVTIAIGNLIVSIHTSSPAIVDVAVDDFCGFTMLQNGAKSWQIYADIDRSLSYNQQDSVYAVNFVQTDGHIYLFREDFAATVNTVKKVCRVRIKTLDILEVFLRVFYSVISLYDNTILLHAAGLRHKDRAHLFVAPPTGGKTTLIGNVTREDVFSDEIVMLKKHKSDWQAYSTPFGGSFPAKSSFNAKLDAIWFLKKSEHWSTLPISKTDSLRRLLKNILFFSNNPSDHEKLLELVSSIIMSVPAYELSFSKEGEVTDYLDCSFSFK